MKEIVYWGKTIEYLFWFYEKKSTDVTAFQQKAWSLTDNYWWVLQAEFLKEEASW